MYTRAVVDKVMQSGSAEPLVSEHTLTQSYCRTAPAVRGGHYSRGCLSAPTPSAGALLPDPQLTAGTGDCAAKGRAYFLLKAAVIGQTSETHRDRFYNAALGVISSFLTSSPPSCIPSLPKAQFGGDSRKGSCLSLPSPHKAEGSWRNMAGL